MILLTSKFKNMSEEAYIDDFDPTNPLAILDKCSSLLVTVTELENGLYDELSDDKIKTVVSTFKLIQLANRVLTKNLREQLVPEKPEEKPVE